MKRNCLGRRQPTTITQANQDVFLWCNNTAGCRIHGTAKEEPLVRFQGWLHERYSPQTVNLRLSAVWSFYRWCVITKRLSVSPAQSVKGAKRPNSHQHKRDGLTNREVQDVMVTCDPATLLGVPHTTAYTQPAGTE